MLKKQTIWLLTMLSLIVVLSVYALTTPDKPSEQTADRSAKTTKVATAPQKKQDGASTAANKLGEIELEKASERGKLQKKYESVIASEKSTTKAASKAYDDMESLETLANTEMTVKDVLLSKGYKNAAVSASGSEVKIYVDKKNLSDKEANSIIRLVNEYLGAGRVVSVSYNLGNGH
ncbi:MAG: SpoIIIAH-like family protein [Sporolactobacillus sp.]|jgi:stage III sporulation protein AH|nr:SpoIIIAH-like family protein [Sporolactobacillus sp.]MCI1882464.1 SpoIIIAH-like family protein [Sporolactobacillus sp.]